MKKLLNTKDFSLGIIFYVLIICLVILAIVYLGIFNTLLIFVIISVLYRPKKRKNEIEFTENNLSLLKSYRLKGNLVALSIALCALLICYLWYRYESDNSMGSFNFGGAVPILIIFVLLPLTPLIVMYGAKIAEKKFYRDFYINRLPKKTTIFNKRPK